jgi:hypothetical protein
VNQCLELAWLKTKSKQMKTFKRRDQQRLSGDSIFQMPRPYHGHQAASVSSVNSVDIHKIRVNSRNSLLKRYLPLYICKESSTNPPFYAKQTQFSSFFAQNRGFAQKTNPKQTQSNPIFISPKADKPNSNPNEPKFISAKHSEDGLIPSGQSWQRRPIVRAGYSARRRSGRRSRLR